MPATIRSEFALALNQVATERGIDPAVVVETIKAAILAAYRKDYGTEELELLTVDLNADTGEAKITKDEKDITPPGFGRIAAQTAKQVILQRIREAEKQAVLSDFAGKVGSIVPGMVLRFDGPNVMIDIGRTQAVMPPSEQNPAERYHLNQRLTFYVEGIRETMRGNEIIVSRAHKGLAEGLFKREVPEVAQGSVELRIVAREAGGRTKVAVYSKQSGVDPVGSCVGQKGVRVQAVINELGNNEKVDIIQWSDDPKLLIIASLAPAKDLSVELNEKKKTAEVLVPEDQLSLAIGREGQNVRLAAKLTGWKIDIRGKVGKISSISNDSNGSNTSNTVDVGKTSTISNDGNASNASNAENTGVVEDGDIANKEKAEEKIEEGTKEKKEEAAAAEHSTTPSVQSQQPADDSQKGAGDEGLPITDETENPAKKTPSE